MSLKESLPVRDTDAERGSVGWVRSSSRVPRTAV